MASYDTDRTWSETAPATTARWPLARTALCSALIVALIEMLLLFVGNGGVLHGVLIDPDCYMHLQRAFRLMTGGWQPGGFDPRINAPFGFAIHWTGLFDMLLAAGAWPLVWMGFDVHAALYIWGSVISPVLLILTLAVFAAGVRAWVEGPSFLWLTALLFTQPQLSGAFLLGRSDHHSLVLGLLLVQLAWLYAALDGRAGKGRTMFVVAFAAGAVAAVQLCTTVEALLTILLISLVMALAWSWFRRDVLNLLAAYWTGCLAVTLAWLALTRGPIFFEPAYDRVSIVHIAALGIGTATIFLASLLARRLPRPAALAIAGTLAVGTLAAIYPDFFLGPWGHLDPAVKAWHREIGELQPLLPDSWSHIAGFLGQFAAALAALPLMLYRLRHGEMGERLAMLAAICGFCLFGALSLAQMRWAGEVQAVILLPWVLTTQSIMRSSVALTLGRRRVPLRSFILMVALLLQTAPVAFARTVPGRMPQAAAGCDWSAAARALANVRPQTGIVMTELWYGPEILWRTGFAVVGAPYEIPPAIADEQRFEKGSAAEARDVLTRRGVIYVLSCGPARDPQILGKPATFPVPGFHLYRVAE
jgi:hypothetical protein